MRDDSAGAGTGASLMLTGCATSSGARSAVDAGEGQSRVYEGKSYDDVYAAALKVMSARAERARRDEQPDRS